MELGGIVALLRPKARQEVGGVRHPTDFGTCVLSQSAVLSQDGAQERKVDALGQWKVASAHKL